VHNVTPGGPEDVADEENLHSMSLYG
jgi:hypothetical protein